MNGLDKGLLSVEGERGYNIKKGYRYSYSFRGEEMHVFIKEAG
jgi:hypothetical protein